METSLGNVCVDIGAHPYPIKITPLIFQVKNSTTKFSWLNIF